MKRILLLLILILILCMFKEYEGYDEYMTDEADDEQVNTNTVDIAKLNSNQVTTNQQKILENTSKITKLQNDMNDLIKKTDQTYENTNMNRTKIEDVIMPVVEDVNTLKTKLENQ